MKLFKSLLIAPATLGLLAPMSVSASEVNLNDISNYSDVDSIEFANSFNNEDDSSRNLRDSSNYFGQDNLKIKEKGETKSKSEENKKNKSFKMDTSFLKND